MISLKLYSNTFSPLATLFEAEFDSLSYDKRMNQIGSLQFRVKLSNAKATTVNLEHYNRVELIDDGIVKFVGYIVLKEIALDTVVIKCRGLLGIFEKRILAGNYVTNGALNAVTETLINNVNAEGDTGILVGNLAINDAVNKSFTNASPFEVLQSFADSIDCQFEVDGERKLNINGLIGEDLSESVFFQYDIQQVSSSNILGFDVTDDGDEITTKAYGKSGSLSSNQEDVAMKTKYGKLEKFRDFRVANSQNDLDAFTTVELSANLFTPNIQLSPSVADNFDVGDTVRVKLRNNLVTIDDNFQVLEKKVKYLGQQKLISIRIGDLPIGFIEVVAQVNKRLKLLEKNV